MKKIPTDAQCETVAGVLKALSHPHRLKILCLLSMEEHTVSELENYTQASQSSVSQFLARMKGQGLVKAERVGGSTHYSIKDPRVHRLLQSLHSIYC